MNCLGDKIISEFHHLNRDDEIPWIVRLLENPDSFCANPGKIYLYNHDCLHILLEQSTTSQSPTIIMIIEKVRKIFSINKSEVNLMKKKNEKKKKYQHRPSEKLAVFFRWSSSFFALIGGLILASNIKISPYGFVVLAGSSSQLLISSLLVEDKSLIIYSGSIFIFVDLLGIYRWLIN